MLSLPMPCSSHGRASPTHSNNHASDIPEHEELGPIAPSTAGAPNFSGRNRFYRAALHWYNFGFEVIPLAPETKRTAVKWNPWLKTLSRSRIKQHWHDHPEHEVGFIVGNEYLVLDADSHKAVAELYAAEAKHEVAPLLIVQTARGAHHYFKKDPQLLCRTTFKLVGEVHDRIDVKTGKTLVALPPSGGKSIVQLNENLALAHAAQLSPASTAFLKAFGALVEPTTREIGRKTCLDGVSDSGTLRLLRAGLSKLSPDCNYETWLRIAAIVFNESSGTEEGFDCFNEWSSQGQKYKGSNEIRLKWKSFRLDHPRPLKMASLRFILEDQGHDWFEVCAHSEDAFELIEEEVQ